MHRIALGLAYAPQILLCTMMVCFSMRTPRGCLLWLAILASGLLLPRLGRRFFGFRERKDGSSVPLVSQQNPMQSHADGTRSSFASTDWSYQYEAVSGASPELLRSRVLCVPGGHCCFFGDVPELAHKYAAYLHSCGFLPR